MYGIDTLKSDLCTVLLLLVIFTLGVMDTFSTVAAINYSGGADDESNLLYRIAYANNGMWSFIALKFVVTIGFALSAFIVQHIWQELKFIYVCLSSGMIIVGVFVTASNLAIALGGNSVTVFSMDALQFSLYILLAVLLFGVVMTIIRMICVDSQKTVHDLYREQSGTWMPAYNGKYRI
jgi:hypothetical protein